MDTNEMEVPIILSIDRYAPGTPVRCYNFRWIGMATRQL